MKTFVLTCLAAVLLVSCSPGEENINYFPVMTPQEEKEALRSIGLDSCADYIKTHFKASDDDTREASRRVLEAIAYERGFCVAQDLSRALALYTYLYQNDLMIETWCVKMAMLYAYGPPEIRAPEKAGFYFRQAAIHTAVIKDPALRHQLLSGLANPDGPPPQNINVALLWLQNFLKKSEEERKALALDLKAQGYQGTEYLWDYLADLEEQNERNQKRLENSRTTLETL